MMSHTPLCSYCALHNPCSLSAKSPYNTHVSSLTSLGSPWTTSLSLQFSLRQELRRRTIESTRRFSGSRQPGSYDSVAVSSNPQFGLVQSEVERTRKQIFEDGFAIFPGMWSKAEVDEVDDDVLVVAQEQEKVLKSFLRDPVDVFSQPQQWLHAPGHCCTDAATSPEPYWHHSWQIAGMEGEALQRPSWSATLVVSLSVETCVWRYGVAPPIVSIHHCTECLFIFDSIACVSSRGCNIKSTQIKKCRVGEEKHMWRWHSMENFLMDQTTSVEEEMVQLQTEEGKAQLGGWHATMEGLPSGQESLATSPSTRTAPRDLLAWRLRNSALQFMQDGEWSNGLSMLLRRAGLRPTCYWTALQAGRCCMKSAPAGQLRGRAGRKCTLEDGERFLLRAIELAPGWPLAYAELMRCLALMGRGREQEIPGVMEMMKQRCMLEQLCLRYPTDSEILQTCWNDSEALCHKFLYL